MNSRDKLGYDSLFCRRICATHLPQNHPRLPINPLRLVLPRTTDREPERRVAGMRRQQRGERKIVSVVPGERAIARGPRPIAPVVVIRTHRG